MSIGAVCMVNINFEVLYENDTTLRYSDSAMASLSGSQAGMASVSGFW